MHNADKGSEGGLGYGDDNSDGGGEDGDGEVHAAWRDGHTKGDVNAIF